MCSWFSQYYFPVCCVVCGRKYHAENWKQTVGQLSSILLSFTIKTVSTLDLPHDLSGNPQDAWFHLFIPLSNKLTALDRGYIFSKRKLKNFLSFLLWDFVCEQWCSRSNIRFRLRLILKHCYTSSDSKYKDFFYWMSQDPLDRKNKKRMREKSLLTEEEKIDKVPKNVFMSFFIFHE